MKDVTVIKKTVKLIELLQTKELDPETQKLINWDILQVVVLNLKNTINNIKK